jgi:Spy/CpxP family protein refolding chaperone
MNYFTKNRILVWLVIAGLAINISAIVTILYRVNKGKCSSEDVACYHKSQKFFKNELNLSTEQEKQFSEMKETSREIAAPLVLKMKEQRKELMNVLFQKEADTIKINEISKEIQQSQSLLLQHTISHYLELKKILRADQHEKLNILYQDLFGCPRMETGKKCGSNCGKADGSGGGNKHRHRGMQDKNNDL